VFSGHPKALLGIRHSLVFGFLVSQKVGLELIHSRIGEHQRWIVFNYHRSRGDNRMGFRLKKFKKLFSDFSRFHKQLRGLKSDTNIVFLTLLFK
jgi:hypothetical protein